MDELKIRSEEIRLVPIRDVKLNHKNRNRHSAEQIDRLTKIIRYQGFRNPVVISNQTGVLIAGEGRYLAAQKLGMKEIPAIFQDFDSPDQETAYGISDNASQADWMDLDFQGIHADLEQMDGMNFDLELLGIKDFTLDPPTIDLSEEKKEEKLSYLECPNCHEVFEKKQAKVVKREG